MLSIQQYQFSGNIMYPKAQNKLFAFKAIKYQGKQEYGVAYYTTSPNYKNGFAYKAKSDSALINILFYNIDASLNYKGVIPPYNAYYAYKAGAVFKLNGHVYVAKSNIEPQNIANAKLQQIDFLDKHIKYAPKAPYYSIHMLTNALENDPKGRKLLKKNKDNPYINLQYIDECMEYQFIDYTNQKNAVINNKDNYRIHLYNELFLTQKNVSQTYAFQFNFLKKIIFINTSTKHFVEMKNNIFKHFPPGTLVKVCKSENDYIDNFIPIDRLINAFNNNVYLLHDKIEITQITQNRYVIEYLKGTELLKAIEAYIDIQQNKIIRFLPNRRETTFPISDPIEKRGNADIISVRDVDTLSVINLMGRSQTPFTCLYLDRLSYILFSTDNRTMTIVSYNPITMKLSIVKTKVSIPTAFVQKGYIPRILKNYGQFPSGQHLLMVDDKEGGSTKYVMFDISDSSNPKFVTPPYNLYVSKWYFQAKKVNRRAQKISLIFIEDEPIKAYSFSIGDPHRNATIRSRINLKITCKEINILSAKVESTNTQTLTLSGEFGSFRRHGDTKPVHYNFGAEGLFTAYGDTTVGDLYRITAPLIDVIIAKDGEIFKVLGKEKFFSYWKTSDSRMTLLPAISKDAELKITLGNVYDTYVKPSYYSGDTFYVPSTHITLQNFRLYLDSEVIYSGNYTSLSNEPQKIFCLWKDE